MELANRLTAIVPAESRSDAHVRSGRLPCARFVRTKASVRLPNLHLSKIAVACLLLAFQISTTYGQAPALESIFPPGGQVGQSVEVTIGGSQLERVQTLRCSIPGVHCARLEGNRFQLQIPATTLPGRYDVWAVCEAGLSAPRTFTCGNRQELIETEPNDTPATTTTTVPLNAVVNGRIAKAGDVDCFRFEAKRGTRVVIDCSAERIDSRLRAVLELFDTSGRRLAVNRGYFGIDPLIDFHVPADGSYVLKLQDLTSSGGPEHYYRLDIDTEPRVAFTVPTVIQRDQATRVAFYGWNLTQASPIEPRPVDHSTFDRVEVEIPATMARDTWPLPVTLHPSQVVIDGLAWHLRSSQAAVVIGLTDVPVTMERSDNHSANSAQALSVPCEVSGQLTAGAERDWYSIQAQRGDVFQIEGIAQRIPSPVDLQIRVLDESGKQELTRFGDEVSISGSALPTGHLDPAGRWIAPRDGRFLIAVENLIGGLHADPRRTYRLCLRREEPDFQLVAVARRGEPTGLNVRRGGREVLDLLAVRRRGFQGAIHVSARDLPVGMECPDVWLGPGIDRGMVVVSANQGGETIVDELKLEGTAAGIGSRPVRGATLVRSGGPTGWGRLISQIPLTVGGETPLRITADGHETLNHHLYGKLKPKHSPGGILDVAVRVERRDAAHQSPVKLIAVGLPPSVGNQTAIIPPGEQQGYLSFYLPPTLPTGNYSLVIRAETTVPTAGPKPETIVVHSDPVTIDVQPAAFLVEADPFAVTQARRGETIQISYTANRRNGFIGKMHTELAVPGHITDVDGLRGRGETFVGQNDKGTLQIVINDNAPLGQRKFLRLFTVGVVEDEPIYQGGGFLTLEIVE